MEEFVSYIVKNIVDKPDDVNVASRNSESELIMDLAVAPDDLGKVIGRKGRVIQALRALISVAGARHGCRVRLELVTDDDE